MNNVGDLPGSRRPRILVLANAAAEATFLARPGGLHQGAGPRLEIVVQSGQPAPQRRAAGFRVLLRSSQPVTGVVLGCRRSGPALASGNRADVRRRPPCRRRHLLLGYQPPEGIRPSNGARSRITTWHARNRFPALSGRRNRRQLPSFNQTWLRSQPRRLEENWATALGRGVLTLPAAPGSTAPTISGADSLLNTACTA